MKKLIKKDLLLETASKTITDFVWIELARLKGQIDTKDLSAAPYQVTTSIYLTGNQILLGLTKESLQEMLRSDLYSAIYQGGLESKTLEKYEQDLKRKEEKLNYLLETNSVKSLKKEIEYLKEKLTTWEEAAEKNGFIYE